MKINKEFFYSVIFGLVVGFLSLAFFYALAPIKDNSYGYFFNNNPAFTTFLILSLCFIFVFYGGWGADKKGSYSYAGGIVYFLVFVFSFSFFYMMYIYSCMAPYALFVLFVSLYIGRGIYRKHIAPAPSPVPPVPPAP